MDATPVAPVTTVAPHKAHKTSAAGARTAARPPADRADPRPADAGPKERPPVEIEAARLQLREQTNNSWTCPLPRGALPEDVDMQPALLLPVARDLKVGDSIRWISETWIADSIVIAKAGASALCRITLVVEVPKVEAEDMPAVPAGYAVRRAIPTDPEPHQDWVAFRLEDGLILHGHAIRTKAEAEAFLASHPAICQPAGKPLRSMM